MNNKVKHWSFDSGSVSLQMLMFMHPAVVMMISWTNFWCFSHGVRPTWTSWMRDAEKNKSLGATSVHEWRGADLSVKSSDGWTQTLRTKFFTEFRKRFIMVGAFTLAKDDRLLRTPIVRHDSGHGDHFHLQCAPNADIQSELRVYTPVRRRGPREQNKDT